ncbi:Phage tail protein [Paracoccus nototheniae]|uniref:COG4223 family protein n=1 Tax=Paracoccus nototheniae TaxID=2489002 RepID=UPI001039A9D4|nr:hypothetical protein [Paracoccus nototheniae]
MKAPKNKTGGPDGRTTDTTASDAAASGVGPQGMATPPATVPESEIRKIPAHVGVIDQTPIREGRPAQAGQTGEVRPDGSTLIGDGSAGQPAAAAKSQGAKTGMAKSDMPKSGVPKSGKPFADTPAPAKTPPPDKADAATPSARSPAAPARKSGFWPLAFGGAVAAGLGAAATIYALPHLPAGWVAQDAPAAVAAEMPDRDELIAAAEDAGRRAAEEVLAAAAPVDAPSDAAPSDASPSGAPAAALPDDLAARIEALEEQTAALSAAPETGAEAGEAPGQPAAIDADQLAQLQQRLDEQQARLDELSARPAFDPAIAQEAQDQIRAAASEAQTSLDAARTEAQQLQEAAAEGTRRAEAIAAIAALQTALDEGVTPDQAREALEGAGLDTPEALQAEVPSLTALQTDFAEAARAALRVSLQQTSASGEGNLVTNFLRAQTGARSVEPREGDDPDAVLSRADADVQAGRIDAALTQLEALPEPARAVPVMADWLSRATAYSQARAALTDLSSGTN